MCLLIDNTCGVSDVVFSSSDSSQTATSFKLDIAATVTGEQQTAMFNNLVTDAEDDDLVDGYTVAANTMQLGSSEFIYLYIHNFVWNQAFDCLNAEGNIIFDLALPSQKLHMLHKILTRLGKNVIS